MPHTERTLFMKEGNADPLHLKLAGCEWVLELRSDSTIVLNGCDITNDDAGIASALREWLASMVVSDAD